MNDNYFPKDQIILTEKEKQSFLTHLPSMVQVDEKIKHCVQIVNDMPYFLTQSSCQGQGDEPFSTHMPVPYISIGVLYNAFELLDDLAQFLLETIPKKLRLMDFSFEVQAINTDNQTGVDVPNFQKYLTVTLKNQRSIPALEEALREFAKKDFEVNTDSENLSAELVQEALWLRGKLGDIYYGVLNPTPLSLVPVKMNELREVLLSQPAFKSVRFRHIPASQGYPENYIMEFFVTEESFDIDNLFLLLTSAFTGGIIASQSFERTSSGSYLKKVHASLFSLEMTDFFATIVKKWAKEGHIY